jgi:uncharacterized membrane-anchored protein
MRRLIILLGGALVLGLANFAIWEKEQLLAQGRVLLLELAPVDPRSLMQGDYMALRFKVARDAFGWEGGWLAGSERRGEGLRDGFLVVGIDAEGVGQYRRLDDGTPLAADEARIRYRVRDGAPKLGTNAFFFQEGHAHYYERARYGEIRLAAGGDLLLTGLRGAQREPLGPAASSP